LGKHNTARQTQPEKWFLHPQKSKLIGRQSILLAVVVSPGTPTIIGFEPRTPCVLPECTIPISHTWGSKKVVGSVNLFK